jgi:type I restriction enzyme, S subunit
MAEYVSLRDQRAMKITLPPLAEQKAIAAVLGAMDDKIELNRRMNATLEAMARALFQSWFIDFDPVRANLDRNQPSPQPSPTGRGSKELDPALPPSPLGRRAGDEGRFALDPATAALFPDSFQDSTLGHIPKGWETGSILRQADLLSGGTPKTDVPAYWNGDVPWASAKDVSQCGEAFLVSTERTITKQGVEESSTKIIPANATVVVARGATTGRLTMFGHAMAMNQTCYGLRSKVGAPFALYCNTRHFIERLVQGGHGSIFDTITTSTFEATEVLLAPKEVLLAFDKQVTPLFQQVHANLHQSHTLATLRDTLLPKLLSGEFKPCEWRRQQGAKWAVEKWITVFQQRSPSLGRFQERRE